MGKEKEDKRKMHFPERVIHTSKIIPKDPEHSFKRFVKKLASKKISFFNAEIEIIELGPREGYKTTFQLIGLMNMSFQFKISYIISATQIDIGYEADSEYTIRVPKFAKRAGERQISSTIIPRIIQAVNKSLEVKEKKPKEPKEKKPKEPKEKTEKKPDDKEKKEKKPKDPLKLLKMQFVEGKISEEEYLHKKKLLED